jgi:hypothetical protein
MQEFRIFTESNADIKFLKDYISSIYDIALDDSYFDILGSWSGYKPGGSVKKSIRENYDNEKNTILIVDADDNFEERREEIITDFEKFDIPISLFLFPNNNGVRNLETLLAEIAIERQVIQCFEQYENCIQNYNLPVLKSKIYAYLDALIPENEKANYKTDPRRDELRDYTNNAHWNLEHEYLQPLRNFLSPFFQD